MRLADDALFLLRLAARNLFRQRARSAATLAAIAFGVAGIVLSGGFVRDSLAQLREAVIHSQSGHLQIARQGYFGAGTRSPEKFVLEDLESVRALARGEAGVADVMARLAFSGLLNNGRADLPVVVEGIEPEAEARLGTHLVVVEGRALEGQDRFQAVVGRGVASALQLKVGDRVNLVVLTGEGAMNVLDFDVAGVFQSYSQEYDARAVKVPLRAAQELLDTKGATVLVVSLARTAQTDSVRDALAPRLAQRGLEARTWLELNDFYKGAALLYERQFGFLQLIILVMVAIGVVNAVNMTVFERVAEFGTMRALGNRAATVVGLVMTEAVLLGLLGSLIGVAVGVALALGISAVGIPMPPPPNSDLPYTARIQLAPAIVAGAFLVGVAAATLAGILPALRVARTPVVDALRQAA